MKAKTMKNHRLLSTTCHAGVMRRRIRYRLKTLILLMLTLLGLSPIAQAVGPDTEGAIAGSNNGEGIGVLVNRTSGVWNTGTGFEALNHLTAGNQNTATGLRALFSDTSGGFNTATGVLSLFSNATGFFNSATGAYSLAHNTDGSNNTADGYSALYFNSEGNDNTATGFAALYKNTTGGRNNAFGSRALQNHVTGDFNNAFGGSALGRDTGGNFNNAFGDDALLNNIDGMNNTAMGDLALQDSNANENSAFGAQALQSHQAGVRNNAFGFQALQHDVTGGLNNAFGALALKSNTMGNFNSAFGNAALLNLTSGSNNTALGSGAGADLETGSGNVYIGAGSSGVAAESNHTYIRNINLTPVNGGGTDTVTVNLTTGLLGHLSSSRRHKEQIKAMDNVSEVLYRLKPVTYRYKKEIDPSQILDYGLVAEDVAEIDPNLTVCNREGQIESVRYNAINAMLLNEFLKEHKKVQEQQAQIVELNSRVAKQDGVIAQQRKAFQAAIARQETQIQAVTAGLKEQAPQIRKVSSQVGMHRLAPHVVATNP
jgi:hypothetical protein